MTLAQTAIFAISVILITALALSGAVYAFRRDLMGRRRVEMLARRLK